jgi:hypothetical protein
MKDGQEMSMKEVVLSFVRRRKLVNAFAMKAYDARTTLVEAFEDTASDSWYL